MRAHSEDFTLYAILTTVLLFIIAIVAMSSYQDATFEHITVSSSVISIDKTWQGDIAPYEQVTVQFQNGTTTQVVFSCNYYQVGSQVNFTYIHYPAAFIFHASNTSAQMLRMNGC